MLNTSKKRTLSFNGIKRCWAFQQGVKDYHSGKWSEVKGTYYKFDVSHLYEAGRLIAAFTGKLVVTERDIQQNWNECIPNYTKR